MNSTSSFLSSSSSSSFTSDDDPINPYESKAWERDGGFILYFLLMCYIFVGFELLCDAFFVPGLNLLCEKFHITKDFAGATLMGIGGNLPDIFSGIIGVCVLNTDVGPGSIVGSMLFNHLCIVGCTVLVVGDIAISVKSITREVTFYVITVIAFLLVLLDQKIELWESIILLILYVIYVIVCGFTQQITKLLKSCGKKTKRVDNEGNVYTAVTEQDDAINYAIDDTVDSQRYKSMKEVYNMDDNDDDELLYEKDIFESYDEINKSKNSSNNSSNDDENIMYVPPSITKDIPQYSTSPVYLLPKHKRHGNGTSPVPSTSPLSKSVKTIQHDDDDNNTTNNVNEYNNNNDNINNVNNNNDDDIYNSKFDDNANTDDESEVDDYDNNIMTTSEGSGSSGGSSKNLKVQESIQRKKENREKLLSTHTKVFEHIMEETEGHGEEVESGSRMGLNYGKVQMHGFLYKKSRYYSTLSISSRVWQKRWFVLDETLWYCRNPLNIDKRKELPLWKAWKISLNKEDPCAIEIHTKKEIYVLRAQEEENARRWVRELKSRVKTVKRMHPELYTPGGIIDVEDEEDEESLLEFPYDASPGHILMWIISLPFEVLFTFTIPDIKKERLQKLLPITFLMVVVWLGGMSYAMVWGAKNFARVLHIPDDIMGISITAIGASLPSLFSSVIAARQGEGNMAISNAFGSNLTCLLALGLPCFVYSSVLHPGKPYESESSVLFVTVAGLFIAIVLFVAVVLLWRLKLKRVHGAFFLFLYLVILTGVILCQVFGIEFKL